MNAANSSQWFAARVRATRELSPTVREICFEVPPPAPSWTVGSHLRVQVTLPDGRTADRRYSLVGLPEPSVPWRIAVKRVPNSRGGSTFMWRLREGDTVSLQAAANHFELPQSPRPTLLVAGGIGITPLFGMALALSRRAAPCDVRMAYAVRHAVDVVYETELRDALGDKLATYVGEFGTRMDLDALIADLPADGQVLACGPVRMLHALQAAWHRAKRLPQRLRFESFGTSGSLPTEPFRVEVPRHGLRFTVGTHQSLLEALEAHGVACLSDCLRGECGLCCVDVMGVDGAVDHRDVYMSPNEQRANKRICACVSRVAGGGIVIDSAWRPDEVHLLETTK